ncbi:MAG: transcription antitermination factor NusB [Acidimicrobiia bacterium]|nr:transcription antitermination factor NusB [Acidimicrobiia bacterium]
MGEIGTTDGVAARRLAIEALERIEKDGAFANLLLPSLLAESSLDERDRGFVTELVYGATRMKRSLDYLADRFIDRDDVDSRVRAALRVGAYQLEFLRVPAHAAVDATVAATPKRGRGFVNAVLRKIARASDNTAWPTEGIRLSYPDWILERLAHDLGDRSTAVLEAMNRPAVTHVREDGYRQDLASQQVAALVEPGGVVFDLCAAPGGKATFIAGRQARGQGIVLGSDIHAHRAGLVKTAAEETGTDVVAVVADATAAPYRPHSADAVLVDAPCSGLGSLRRRADARWRIEPRDVDSLATLQRSLIGAAFELVKPGGQIVFSVCTLTSSESTDIDDRIAKELPQLEPQSLPEPWELWGRGGRLLPDRFEGDGMAAFVYRCR